MSGNFNGQIIGKAVDRIWSPTGELLSIIQAPLSVSALGNNSLVAAQAGKQIYVCGLFLVTAGAVTVEFRSGATTSITGVMSFAANQQLVLPFSDVSWFNTNVGEALTVQLSAAVSVTGGIKYVIF